MKREFTWKEQEKIYLLRAEACSILNEIDSCFNDKGELTAFSEVLEDLKKRLEDVEFRMQDAWGFERDVNKHTWWMKPKHCTCPKMDNTDPAYFGGGKLIVSDCPVHGMIYKS